MDFFTSPEDLKGWVKVQDSPDEAVNKIMEIIGPNDEQDIFDTCKTIFESDQQDVVDNASNVLFGVLAKHNITKVKEGKMNNKMKKEAQGIYRGTAPFYQSMPLRVCPKLPADSNINPASKRLISTFHCRENCLDSFTFDDEPERVYCAEALWRRHVMDKFSREWKNEKGKWVGGYINERFQVYHDDGGNQMELANNERTRVPRPHQYSTERRLEEARGEKTYDITLADSKKKMVKLASTSQTQADEEIHQIFRDIIEMRESGLTDEDIIYKVAEHYNRSIINVASVYKFAMKQLQRHNGTVYSCDSSKFVKTAQVVTPAPSAKGSTMVTQNDVEVVSLANGQKTVLKIETPVVIVSDGTHPVFEIVDGPDAGNKFTLANQLDMGSAFGAVDGVDMIQDAADELGLNEDNAAEVSNSKVNDFPVIEM